MIRYRAPLRDFDFVLRELLGYSEHLQGLEGVSELEWGDVEAVLDAAARFAESKLVPLYQSGDREGCRLKDGEVCTPQGFREVYEEYRAGGWTAVSQPERWGGSALPASLATATTEIFATANWSWSMYPNLLSGAMDTLGTFGTDAQKARYLPNLVSGMWCATMCLTEPQCGSDLSLVRTRAETDGAGGWLLSGNKIFITAGDHDLTENIVHIVLARLPGAPEGTRGLSLFIVPKLLVGDSGGLAERNAVSCSGLEEKMGLNGSATCALNFDGARAELLGPPHRGLECMFVFMNAARIGAGQQGVVHAELAYQNALAYCGDRRASRAPNGDPRAAPQPIVVQPDVRRMLLEQRAIAEGGRALIMESACLLDQADSAVVPEVRERAKDRLALLTPIIKGFLTELGVAAADLALQCLGGHGYIREWGLEQNLRDSRVSTLYEGTTGIQALDLLGRKVVRDEGRTLQRLRQDIEEHCAAASSHGPLSSFASKLNDELVEWDLLTTQLIGKALRDPFAVPAAATDYLMYSGYLVMGDIWLRSALIAHRALDSGLRDQHYHQKMATACFYFERILPRTLSLRTIIASGPSTLLAEGDLALTPEMHEEAEAIAKPDADTVEALAQ